MSQFSSVNVNFNLPTSQINYLDLTKALIIGVSQRGPIYKVVEIIDINTFIIVFGQPTNQYEFDFFQAMKSVVENGGVACCYRIPYTDGKNLDATTIEYYIGIDEDAFNVAFHDSGWNNYYQMYSDTINNRDVLKLQKVLNPKNKVEYIILKLNEKFYKIFVNCGKVYAEEIVENVINEHVYDTFYVKNLKSDKFESHINVYYKNNSENIGLYLENDSEDKMTILNVMYKYDNNVLSSDIKLSFTPINDFNSVLNVYQNDDETEISADSICYNIKANIDPSQIIGIFPVVFGTKDAENLRNLNLEKVYPYSTQTENYIDIFDVYTCNGEQPYKVESSQIFNELFDEFEKSSHFKSNWLKSELSKLIDEYVPQDISTAPNTMGIVFIAYYLDDEHKLDYKILESYYGLVGYSNNQFDDLEDLVNENSNFFRLKIEGTVKETQYLKALDNNSLVGGKWIVPMVSPFTEKENRHLVDMTSIFSKEPSTKFNEIYSQPLSKLFEKLLKTEYLNSVPFDYIVAPGIVDILLLKDTNSMIDIQLIEYNDTLVPYVPYQVNLDDNIPIEIEKIHTTYQTNIHYENVKSFYRLLTFATSLGDKGAISIIDVPQIFNDLFIKDIEKCTSDVDIKQMIKVLDYIFPNLKGNREIYDRTYPICNYQRVDKDSRLTRYNKFRPLRKFDIVPGSAMMVGAYIYETVLNIFDPIAGPRIKNLFTLCHHCYIDMKRMDLFKVLFDTYGVSSLINDRDNNTFPIQQTTWRNTTSVLKQIHAFRIYVEIRRRAYEILKSYLYEPNIENNRNQIESSLTYLLHQFKENHYIDNLSNAKVWADIPDIEAHQVQVILTVGIYGAIVKIIVNMNLQDMTIEIVE